MQKTNYAMKMDESGEKVELDIALCNVHFTS
jgi:hypothetical protein